MSADLFKLDGKVALVTGGSKGLGLAMAKALAGAGASIALNSRHGDEAEAAATAIASKHSVQTLGYQADVTQLPQFHAFVQNVEDKLGGVDILVANAGVNLRQPTTELPLKEWRRVLDVNLTGPFLCSQAVLPRMIQKGWGRIIHLSSIMGLVGLAGRPPYTAAKGGLVLLTKTQALELAPHGVTVNALCPGPFATEMNKPLLNDPAKYRDFISKIPMGRWGKMNELDGAIVFLASEASSFMTGTTLTVDGGWTAQ